MPGSTHEYYFSNLRVLPQYIEGIRVLKGVELNILDVEGNIDLDERTLSFLDYAIASLHPPCYEGGSKSDNTNALINAMQHKIVKIIGHPDDGRYPLDYEKLVKAAQKHGVLLEVNNSSLSPNAFRENAYENYKEMLAYCMKQGVKIIINSDAHITNEKKQASKHNAAKDVGYVIFCFLILNYMCTATSFFRHRSLIFIYF